MSFDRFGSGRPLLLLHGFGSTRQDFAAVIPGLAQDFQVWSTDLPGHGSSPTVAGRPTVHALTGAILEALDAQGLDRVHVLGNSLGGRLAIELARRGRASSVVAISPSGLGLPPERVHQGALMTVSRLLNQGRRPWIDGLSQSVAGRTALLAGLRAQPWLASPAEALTVKGGFADARSFWPMLWHSILLDVPTGLNEIRCPVVVAQGALDIVGAGQTPRYTALIPGSRFVVLPGGGHAPQSDTPSLIIDLVRQAALAADESVLAGSSPA